MGLKYFYDVMHDYTHRDPVAKFLLLMMADDCGGDVLYRPNFERLGKLTGLQKCEIEAKFLVLERRGDIEVIRDRHPWSIHMFGNHDPSSPYFKDSKSVY